MISGNKRFRLFGALFILAFAALGAAISYPIYQTSFFFVTVGAAVALGAGIALLAARLKWSSITIALAALLTFAVLGLPLTNPAALGSIQNIGAGWVETVRSLLFGWKQLVTIELPVGDYHALLAPAFIVFFVSTLLATYFVFAKPKLFWAATIPFYAMTLFGISFGKTTVAGDFNPLNLDFGISIALAAGIALVLLSIGYLAWASNAVRRGNQVAINVATSDNKLAPLLRYLRRFGSAIGVLALAILVASVTISSAGVPSNRRVIRSAVEPLVKIAAQVSPLSTYREFLSDPAVAESTILTYASTGDTPSRIRLQVMPYYDGTTFRVTPSDGNYDANSVFTRTPSNLASRTGTEDTTRTSITMGNYDSIWLPLVDNVKNVDFTGPAATALADGFYMNRNTYSGALVPGPSAGASYTIESYLDPNPTAVADILTTDGSNIQDEYIPQSLKDWVSAQTDKSVDGLIKKLRARGYLSHSLEKPTEENNWISRLTGYKSFESSLAGHSVARVDSLFRALNERQRGSKSKLDKDLVAGIGDDEQFATAAALIAASRGYTVRVVVGFRTVPAADAAYAVEPCDKGVCAGHNLTAWIELATGNGGWLALDTTPQFKNPVTVKTDNTVPPKNPSNVDEDTSEVVPPEPGNPNTDCEKSSCDSQEPWDLTWLWALLGTVLTDAVIVAFVASPFVLIIGTKVRRRRGRRASTDPAAVVTGAWDEYLDTQVDYGKSIPRAETRSEIAASYGSESALILARLSDEAAFASYDPSPEIVATAWNIVDAETAARKAEANIWRKAMALLSLRSFLRYVKPEEQLTKLKGALAFSSGESNFQGSTFKALVAVTKKQVPVAYRFGKAKAGELFGKARGKIKRVK